MGKVLQGSAHPSCSRLRCWRGGTAGGSPQPGFGEVWGSLLHTNTDPGGSCMTFRALSSHLPTHLQSRRVLQQAAGDCLQQRSESCSAKPPRGRRDAPGEFAGDSMFAATRVFTAFAGRRKTQWKTKAAGAGQLLPGPPKPPPLQPLPISGAPNWALYSPAAPPARSCRLRNQRASVCPLLPVAASLPVEERQGHIYIY
nr:uncharacterized protein LOC106047521 isoform X3 [Anser cygnoides]